MTSISPHLWNDFVKEQPLGSLHQTSIWAHFQEQIPGKGKTSLVVVAAPEDKHSKTPRILGGGLLIHHSLPFGLSWLECPRGPVFDTTLSSDELEYFFKNFLEQVQEIAEKNNAVFLRTDPAIIENSDFASTYNSLTKKYNFKSAHASYFPQTTLTIDLNQSEKALLEAMKSKGRYNIKLAQRHGVTIEKAAKSDLPLFYKLIAETGARDGFATHNLAYYETMLDALGDSAQLFLAYTSTENNKPKTIIAGMIATYFGNTATYYYGASSYEHRQFMAPYLLQWHVMLDAKKQNYTTYDLLGVSTPNKKNDPLQGVTDFKTKLTTSSPITYLPAKELIYKPIWHILIRARKALKSKR